MILQAVIDDSTARKRRRFFALAGFIATYTEWARFADEWAVALGEIPSVSYFKMSEANALRGEFDEAKGWTREAARAKISRLVAVIRPRVLLRISSVISVERWNADLKGRLPGKLDDPYCWCFFQIVLGAAAACRVHGITGQIDFVFDEHGAIWAEAVKWFDGLKQQIREVAPDSIPYLGSRPIFRDDKLFNPLQAADLYVNSFRRLRDHGLHLIAPTPYEIAELVHIPAFIPTDVDVDQIVRAIATPVVASRGRASS